MLESVIEVTEKCGIQVFEMRKPAYILPCVILAAILVTAAAPLYAQDDGRIVFADPKSKEGETLSEEDLNPSRHVGGVDIMIGNDGFGLGFFYNYLLSDEWTLFATTSFSEAEDSRQRSYYTYWGEEIPINQKNHIFRIPLFFGIQYRLFKDEIVEDFRPFVNAGAGPVMLYVAPAVRTIDNEGNQETLDFLASLPYGKPQYTYGGFLGAGAQFGFDRSSILGVNVRYYIIPAPSGLQAVDQGELSNANGFFITLMLGTTF